MWHVFSFLGNHDRVPLGEILLGTLSHKSSIIFTNRSKCEDIFFSAWQQFQLYDHKGDCIASCHSFQAYQGSAGVLCAKINSPQTIC
jgi:hypothetical protein